MNSGLSGLSGQGGLAGGPSAREQTLTRDEPCVGQEQKAQLPIKRPRKRLAHGLCAALSCDSKVAKSTLCQYSRRSFLLLSAPEAQPASAFRTGLGAAAPACTCRASTSFHCVLAAPEHSQQAARGPGANQADDASTAGNHRTMAAVSGARAGHGGRRGTLRAAGTPLRHILFDHAPANSRSVHWCPPKVGRLRRSQAG